MRYYDVKISTSDGQILVPNYNNRPGFTPVDPSTGATTYSSLNAGMNLRQYGCINPNALRFQVDAPVAAQHAPKASAFIRIWGISLGEIAQSADLTNLNIRVSGGMGQGLPLSNPAQASTLFTGQILQSYSNWEGCDQNLNIYVAPGGSSQSASQITGQPSTFVTVPTPASNKNPGNLVFYWEPGQNMIIPIVQTLAVAFPQYQIKGAISDNLVLAGAPAVGFFANMSQFSQYLHDKSLSIIGGYAPDLQLYPGVHIYLQNNTWIITDTTSLTQTKQINLQDLIGQVTWHSANTCTAYTVLRGDINPGDIVRLPNNLGTINASQPWAQPAGTQTLPGSGGYSSKNIGLVFSGVFQVTSLRHVGDSRGAENTAWLTTLELTKIPPNEASQTGNAAQSLPLLYAGNKSFTAKLP